MTEVCDVCERTQPWTSGGRVHRGRVHRGRPFIPARLLFSQKGFSVGAAPVCSVYQAGKSFRDEEKLYLLCFSGFSRAQQARARAPALGSSRGNGSKRTPPGGGGGGRGDRGAGSLVAADDARLVWDFSKRIDELKESRWCLKTRDRRTDARWRQEGRGSRQRVLCLLSTRTLTHTLRLPSVSDATCRGRPVDLQLLQHD